MQKIQKLAICVVDLLLVETQHTCGKLKQGDPAEVTILGLCQEIICEHFVISAQITEKWATETG